MSDVEIKDKGDGKARSKKIPTRVDFTPMVDLGFLLITFFMLATTLSKPQAMELNVPAKEDKPEDQAEVKASKVLTLVLGPDDSLYYYHGVGDTMVVGSIDFSLPKNVEPIIYERQEFVQYLHQDKDEMIVLIKAMSASRYRNMVNVLDEMSITNTKRYALVDFIEADSMIIYGLVAEE
jgi:biopolymer transport protein ExbD